jgi:hypothetical protein
VSQGGAVQRSLSSRHHAWVCSGDSCNPLVLYSSSPSATSAMARESLEPMRSSSSPSVEALLGLCRMWERLDVLHAAGRWQAGSQTGR